MSRGTAITLSRIFSYAAQQTQAGSQRESGTALWPGTTLRRNPLWPRRPAGRLLRREAFELLPYPHAAPARALLVSTGGAGALKHSYSRAIAERGGGIQAAERAADGDQMIDCGLQWPI